MKNEINTQRQSSSTADGTSEINPKASPPLDEASCSASSFDLERGYQWVVDRWKNGFSEEEEKVRNELREELRLARREILLQK